VPKASGLINEHERQIAARVRQVRNSIRFSQSEFADVLGETLNRIASIEYARTPLTVPVADKIAGKFNVNLKWLKTGVGNMKPSIGSFLIFLPQTKPSTLLSQADVDALEAKSSALIKFNILGLEVAVEGEIALPKGKKQKEMLQIFHDYFDDEFNRLPHHGRQKLMALALRTVAKFSTDWMRGDEQTPGENISMKLLPAIMAMETDLFKGEEKEFELTHLPTSNKKDAVNHWHRLKAQIQKATEIPGGRSMLAKFLGTDLTQISRWLSKTGPEPGADYTLKMLQWVQERESKQ
jgi:transcriptional regulator with XRE-family HTH domain